MEIANFSELQTTDSDIKLVRDTLSNTLLADTSSLFDLIYKQYSAPPRVYHNLHHIAEILRLLDSVSEKLSDYQSVCLAALFHDFIYDTKEKRNEEMSAKAAKEILANFNLTPNTVESTIRLIHATSSHVAQKADLDTNYFLDSDLATLGSPENTYSQYALAIRAEYGWVPESIYRVERRKVLESFITREHIYATKEMSDRFEGQARINILRELSEFLSQS